MSHLETDRNLNTDLVCWKKYKELTVGFHGKSANSAGEVVDEFVGFLKTKPQYALPGGRGQQKRANPYERSLQRFTEPRRGNQRTTSLKALLPAKKRTCDTKPAWDEIAKQTKGREGADFAHVGHSNLDRGFPLMQLELWHLTVVSTMPMDMWRGVQDERRRKSSGTERVASRETVIDSAGLESLKEVSKKQRWAYILPRILGPLG